MFSRFDAIPERHGQPDRQTDGQTEQNSYIKIAITKEERLNHYTRNALLLLIHQAFVNTKNVIVLPCRQLNCKRRTPLSL